MRRKLFAGAVSCAFGAAAGARFGGGALVVIALIFLSIHWLTGRGFRLGKIFPEIRAGSGELLAYAGMAVLGACLISLQLSAFAYGRVIDGRAGWYRARVLSVERYRSEPRPGSEEETYKYKMECRLTGLPEGVPAVQGAGPYRGDRILISYYQKIEEPWRLIGSELRFYGTPEEPDPARNPRCFDYRAYLRSRGISHTISVRYFRVEDSGTSPVFRIERRIRKIREDFLASMDGTEEQKQLAAGVLFGDSKTMDEDLQEDFRANGTAHVLAVSGLHVGVLYGVFRAIRKKWRSPWLTCAFIGFLLFYGCMTLWAVSVARAVLLILIVMAGEATDRRYDLLTALGAVSLVILIRNPSALFGVSFQMSFLAVLSIAFLTPALSRILPEGAASALAIQAGMVPYTAYVFNTIPILAILINIPVIWLTGILVPAGILALLTQMGGRLLLLGIPAAPARHLFLGLAQLMIWLNRICSSGGRFQLDAVSPPLAGLLVFYLVTALISSELGYVAGKRHDWKLIAAAAGACLILGISLGSPIRLPFDKSSFIMVDVGQGDCLHARNGQGLDILFDGGGSLDYEVGEKTLKPYLLKNGIRQLDRAFATHLHTDHYLGLKQLADCYPVGQLTVTGRKGQVISYPGCRIHVLWPLKEDPEAEDENVNSKVYRVEAGGLSVLVTADISSEGEKMLIDAYRGTDALHADILKVAHHGSAYSSSLEFLKAVHPSAAVIGVGKKNTFGHPTPEALARLKECGIPVWRTDLDGAVGFRREGEFIEVCSMLGGDRRVRIR